MTTPAFTKKEEQPTQKANTEKAGTDQASTDLEKDTPSDASAQDKKVATKDKDEKGLVLKGDAEMEKTRRDVFKENETTVSVSWTGGGQDLKSRWSSPLDGDVLS